MDRADDLDQAQPQGPPSIEGPNRHRQNSWRSRFLIAAVVLTVGMTLITAGLVLIGLEKRPIGEIVPTGLVYCAVFSALYASAPTLRERLHKRPSDDRRRPPR